MKKVVTIIIIIFLLLNAPIVMAEITPALTVEQHGGHTNPGTNRTHGWEFTVDQDIQVVALGIFDFEDDGLYLPHEVGIWHTGDLVLSATVPAGTDTLLVDDFRYVEIDPFWLDAGETYIIGNTMPGDPFVGNDSESIITMMPFITYERTMISVDDSGFALPTLEVDSFYRLGPNFLIIPEPTTGILLGLGAFIIQRTKKR